MTDAQFVAAFEDCSLADDCFRHRDHIRLAERRRAGRPGLPDYEVLR